ncbi:MAG: hypothetical protein B7Z60_00780 [Ferrovum sp. 37-45-19]|nr:MAG: hypothetical protein B7Z65_04070 [Ferrovum sp. 21-44-67]OYV95515.1 MAG: hypothetical protein B7Z60_00780 [Ferrovum sp. 37-45-19]OZB31558.1 MAG: hypothetical protein B7X47_09970 [Ferrovum sp. 34-44-207]HQT81313.1 alpha/beta hydrolase [Ferrovaceae bacterium]HQU05766.1 alpha/beta hydrolase [Ferrovaceae bacterium]
MIPSPPNWQNWSEEEAQLSYDNSKAVNNVLEITSGWRERSDQWVRNWPLQETIQYGTHTRQAIQVFLPHRLTQTLFMFIHGGYWQSRAKEDFYFLSEPYVAKGVAVAHIGYPLAPELPLRAIISSINQGLLSLQQYFDNQFTQQILCGWSAGAHLALMSDDYPWLTQRLLISGIYDLAPLVKTRYFPSLQVDLTELSLLSPLYSKHSSPCPTKLWVGDEELPELIRQTQSFVLASQLNDSLTVMQHSNHFTILEKLLDPSTVFDTKLLG